MSCYNCICPGCVLNCELEPRFFTLGEFPSEAEAALEGKNECLD